MRATTAFVWALPDLTRGLPLPCVSQYTLSHTRLKKRHGITDERASLYEEARPRHAQRAAAPTLPG